MLVINSFRDSVFEHQP